MIERPFQKIPAQPTAPSWPPPEPSAVPPAPPDEIPIDGNILLLAIFGLILFLAVHRSTWLPMIQRYWATLPFYKQSTVLFIPQKTFARVSNRLKNL